MERKFLNQAAAKYPIIVKAIEFARDAHASINHVRKYSGERYTVHTEEVADTIAERFSDDVDAIIAALFHDIIEDVFPKNPKYDLFLIGNTFGKRVADLVVELTDVYTSEAWPDKNRKERKELERERISKISITGKNIKLADFLSNTSSIVANDPNFARVYLSEKEATLPFLMDADSTLLARTGMQLWDAKGKLKMFRPLVVGN